jgi:rhodanese-related sulfurtransferase
MKKVILILIFVSITASFLTPLWAYDEELAKKYESFFDNYKDENIMSSIGMIKANELYQIIESKKEVWILDVRTPNETSIMGMTYKNTLTIPMNEVFKPENLAKIPKDKQVVVVCQKGPRAAIIATALRNIGFKDVKILMGGMAALIEYLCPDNLFKVQGK